MDRPVKVGKMNTQRSDLIIVIDDDAHVLFSLQSLLESAGYRVMVFPSAERFLESGEAHRASCVVTDIRMPGMSGVALRLVLGQQQPDLPVILITGRFDYVDLYDLVITEDSLIFEKPLDTSSLVETIQKTARSL